MDITNITFDELAIGDGIEVSRLVTARDVELFAVVSGDHNPLHLDPDYAATTQFGECIGHGMLIGAFVSAVIGLEFMGPGTVYLGQNLEFRSPIFWETPKYWLNRYRQACAQALGHHGAIRQKSGWERSVPRRISA